jgi:hypothetical protein
MSGRDDIEALPHWTWPNGHGAQQLDTLKTNGQTNVHIDEPSTPVLHEGKSVPEALFRRRHIQFLVICNIVLQPSSLMTRSFHWYRSLLRNGAASRQIGPRIPISLVCFCGYGDLRGDG